MQMTDFDLLTRERHAAAHLRDALMQLLGRMEHQDDVLFPADDDWLHDRIDDLKKALDMHKDRRDPVDQSARLRSPKGR
jgi:predicted component of type VI protein secretion system